MKNYKEMTKDILGKTKSNTTKKVYDNASKTLNIKKDKK
jgi:hypothetical protein